MSATSRFSARYDPGEEVSPDQVLSLHRNENLFVGPAWTVEAARELVEQAAIASYPDASCRPLREALADLYGVEPGCVFVGNGADEVLSDLLGVLREAYTEVHVPDVCFGVYPLLAERLGYRQQSLAGDTFLTGHIVADGFDGLALVDSPNSISGSRVELAALLGLAESKSSFLIWDNVYGEYAGDELPAPLPENVAFVRSFSKYYGLAGLRVGYCIASSDLVSEMLARKDIFNVNGFAQVMALEALRRRDDFGVLRDRLVGARHQMIERLEDLGFRVRPSDSVAVLVTHPAHAGEYLQQELLNRNVAVRRFSNEKTSDFIRITVAPRRQRERLFAALTEIVDPAGHTS